MSNDFDIHRIISNLLVVGLVFVVFLLVVGAGVMAARAGEVQESLTTLQKFYDLVRNYRIEVTLTSMYPVTWIFQFIGTQGIKRKLRVIRKGKMTDPEVWAVTYTLGFGLNALAWRAFIPDVGVLVILIIMVTSAFMYERSINALMDWARAGTEGSRKRAFYYWMRNDRRGRDRKSKKPDWTATDDTQYTRVDTEMEMDNDVTPKT